MQSHATGPVIPGYSDFQIAIFTDAFVPTVVFKALTTAFAIRCFPLRRLVWTSGSSGPHTSG